MEEIPKSNKVSFAPIYYEYIFTIYDIPREQSSLAVLFKDGCDFSIADSNYLHREHYIWTLDSAFKSPLLAHFYSEYGHIAGIDISQVAMQGREVLALSRKTIFRTCIGVVEGKNVIPYKYILKGVHTSLNLEIQRLKVIAKCYYPFPPSHISHGKEVSNPICAICNDPNWKET